METRRNDIFVIALICLCFMACLATPINGNCEENPKYIMIVLPGTGSVGYQSGTGLAASLQEITGVRFTTTPATKTMGRFNLLKSKKAHFSWNPALDNYFALKGTEDFKEMGPQSVRTMWDSGPIDQGIATRADSGIKTVADLKGKRVATYPTYPVVHLYMESAMAYADLSWDDVIPTPVSSFPAGQKAVIEGAVDVAAVSGQSAAAYELQASIHGIHWIGLPNKTAKDKAAWARFNKVNPAFYPNHVTTAAGSSKEKPIDIWGYNYQGTCYDWSDQDIVYWMVKTMAENYESWSKKHSYLKKWTINHNLNSDLWFVPRAEGYIRYFKEKGMWTEKMQKKQDELLAMYPQTMTK